MTQETSTIQITTSGEEPGAKTLKVEIPVERVRAAEQDATAEYAKRVKLRGFRKGKAPLTVVRKQYRDAIREQTLRELIGESWKAAIEQEDLKPIADPGVRSLKFEDGAPVTFELVVEVMPELALERIGNFTLTRTQPPVTDEAVEQQIEEVRFQRASWVPVEDERPENGHLVSFTMATLEDGEAEEAKPYQLMLGSGQAIPELEEFIMTLLPGETKESMVKYPDDFPDETKRGQPRRVRVTLTDVKRRHLPDLDDDLARELGDFDSVDALRAAVRQDLEANAKREADADVRRQVIEQIASANNVQAPDPMVRRILGAYAQNYGVPDDQLEKFTTEFRPIAERQVVRDLIIDHIARSAELAASEEELDKRIEELASLRDTEPAKLYASLQKSNQLREVERSLTEEKVFNHLIEQSKVVDG
ncbi:MAG: trigger factor [Gemmatimonadales bacterium]|jgi:trigger factor